MEIKTILSEISEAVFPSNIYCSVCGSLINRSRPYALCDSCVKKMHWITGKTCAKCGKALQDTYVGRLCYDCMETEHYFTRGFSCLTYGMHEREIMMDIKYNGKGYMALKMGDILFDRMSVIIGEAAQRNIRLFDVVIPVPVSEKRLTGRGYNQSQLMAEQMIRRWREETAGNTAFGNHVPELMTDVLVREKETVMLRSLSPAERRLALKGAFGVKFGSEEKIKDRSILLIDDIYTTGATADTCSESLLAAGAESVCLLSLCSGGNRAPGI